MPKKKQSKVKQHPNVWHDFSEVHFSPYNPRVIDDAEYERLKKSLLKYGLVDPLVLNVKTMNNVGGNQRMKALLELGEIGAPFVEVSLTLNEEKALNLALNKISGDWDMEKLSSIIDELSGAGVDMDLTGFSDIEVEALSGLDEGLDLGSIPEPPEMPPSDDNEDEDPTPSPHKNFVVYFTFKDKDRAEALLKHLGVTYEFAGRNRETVFSGDEIVFD